MQDFLHVVPKARCGFLCAGMAPCAGYNLERKTWICLQSKFLCAGVPVWSRHAVLCTGVFDGHGGDSAADYLSRKFYDLFSEEVSEEVYGKECSNEGWAHQSRCCIDIYIAELYHNCGPL